MYRLLPYPFHGYQLNRVPKWLMFVLILLCVTITTYATNNKYSTTQCTIQFFRGVTWHWCLFRSVVMVVSVMLHWCTADIIFYFFFFFFFVPRSEVSEGTQSHSQSLTHIPTKRESSYGKWGERKDHTHPRLSAAGTVVLSDFFFSLSLSLSLSFSLFVSCHVMSCRSSIVGKDEFHTRQEARNTRKHVIHHSHRCNLVKWCSIFDSFGVSLPS